MLTEELMNEFQAKSDADRGPYYGMADHAKDIEDNLEPGQELFDIGYSGENIERIMFVGIFTAEVHGSSSSFPMFCTGNSYSDSKNWSLWNGTYIGKHVLEHLRHGTQVFVTKELAKAAMIQRIQAKINALS